MKYVVISSYTGAVEEEFEYPAHNLNVLGYTEDPEEMRKWARKLFDATIDDDLELHKGFYSEEDLQELREQVEVIIYASEKIRAQMEQNQNEDPIIIGTLYNFNERFVYVDHIIVAAIPTQENTNN